MLGRAILAAVALALCAASPARALPPGCFLCGEECLCSPLKGGCGCDNSNVSAEAEDVAIAVKVQKLEQDVAALKQGQQAQDAVNQRILAALDAIQADLKGQPARGLKVETLAQTGPQVLTGNPQTFQLRAPMRAAGDCFQAAAYSACAPAAAFGDCGAAAYSAMGDCGTSMGAGAGAGSCGAAGSGRRGLFRRIFGR